ncbi:hypothetical protein [Ferrimonas sp. YFM]|uniref:hypothetical protein n=1 Tax=Ferrimonas sp. YFM TaxID=3028878 RepID=UPI002572F3D9|nr:hypothetical protein [Ferrimonas sp. YFM]BDY04326.1 hypothetical protein F0521_13670 [Ferrimonas sp. YFM]
MGKYVERLVCGGITLGLFCGVAYAATHGNLAQNLARYQSDTTIFVLYIILGLCLTVSHFSDNAKTNIWLHVSLSSAYFYTAFCLFSDGYVGGWSHSKDILTDKLLMGLLFCVSLFLTLIIPLAAMVLGLINAYSVKLVKLAVRKFTLSSPRDTL